MKNRKIFSRVTLMTVLALALALSVVGGTLAWLASTTLPITNTFTLGEVDVEIEEKFSEGNFAKTEIIILNPDDSKNVDAYVRVALVPMIVDSSGNIQGETVTLDQLNPSFNTDTGDDWFLGNDGYYYYKKVLPVGEATETSLINSINLFVGDKTVRLDVIADGVQAYPAAAVESVWPAVDVVDGELEVAT